MINLFTLPDYELLVSNIDDSLCFDQFRKGLSTKEWAFMSIKYSGQFIVDLYLIEAADFQGFHHIPFIELEKSGFLHAKCISYSGWLLFL